MSRIGRKPIDIPGGVEISVKPGEVTVKGPKGELVQEISPDMTVKVDGDVVTVERPTDREIQGVGYRGAAKGRDLELALGYSHPVSITAPEGIEFDVPQPTEVVVRGIDKQKVGQIAANIRESRPPEPYKGKGIRYRGEHVVRKVGKRV